MCRYLFGCVRYGLRRLNIFTVEAFKAAMFKAHKDLRSYVTLAGCFDYKTFFEGVRCDAVDAGIRSTYVLELTTDPVQHGKIFFRQKKMMGGPWDNPRRVQFYPHRDGVHRPFPKFDAKPGFAPFKVWANRSKVLKSLKKFVDGKFDVQVPPEDVAAITNWVHSIPDAVEDVPQNELPVFWSPLQLPGGHSEILGHPVMASSTTDEVKPEVVLPFGKLPAEVLSEKRKGDGISGAHVKRKRRKGKRGKDYKLMSTSGTKKIGARVIIRARHFGLKWAQDSFPKDGGNKVLVGTICCNAYQKKKRGVLWGVMWDTDHQYDEHSSTSLRLAREQPPIQIVMCNSGHVLYQNVAKSVTCDDCTTAASERGDVHWTCDQCNFDICKICAKKRWAYPKSCMQE